MLPLRREEIVAGYGVSLFITGLKVWFSFLLALYVVAWMPLPGTIREAPSLEPFLESFVAQFPLFGILTLAFMRPGGLPAVKIGGIVAALAALIVAVMALIARNIGTYDPTYPLIVSAFIFGLGLIRYSYQCWLRAEVD
jgi:hypothetical protein